ncbi:MAG: hypothetical protein EXR94_14645 [Gemmatimonadetes bacterium]|nr:hypothetical protein [Gemmatimonadota bacterium]
MATPPLRRSWPVTLPAVHWAGLLWLVTLAGFIVVATLPGALDQLAFTPSAMTLRPWTVLSYLFAHTGPLSLSLALDLAALLLLAPRSSAARAGGGSSAGSTPWDVIDLDALHETNREGVEVLLHRARELGPTHLRPADRELLDRRPPRRN